MLHGLPGTGGGNKGTWYDADPIYPSISTFAAKFGEIPPFGPLCTLVVSFDRDNIMHYYRL